jgi:hypothetical protein
MTTTPQAYTVAYPFPRNAEHKPSLFQVNPGVSANEALEHASLILAAVHDMAMEVVQLDLGNDTWGMVCLIDMAKAVVDSVSCGVQ